MLGRALDDSLKADVLDLAPMMIAVHDTDQSIVWANKAYQKATGLTVKEMGGRECFTIWGLSKPCTGCPVAASIQKGEPQEVELTQRDQDYWPATQGSWLVRAVPLRDETGSIVGAIETAFEITKQKEAEDALRETERNYRSMVENTGDVIFEINEAGYVTYISPNIEDVLLYTYEDKINTHFKEAVCAEDVSKAVEGFEYHKKGGRVPVEFRMVNKDGDIVWVSVLGRLVVDGEKKVFRCILRDITERMKAEEALVQERDNLKKALSEISLLRGILPICSVCKKIRDDKGYWNRLEAYIEAHSDVDFSHSICPECAEEHYPKMDLYDD